MLFTITINNFYDSDDNKIKFKKIFKKDAIQSRRTLIPYSLVLMIEMKILLSADV